MFSDLFEKLRRREDLTEDESGRAMAAVMRRPENSTTSPSRIPPAVIALRLRRAVPVPTSCGLAPATWRRREAMTPAALAGAGRPGTAADRAGAAPLH